MAHTPGPWQAKVTNDGGFDIVAGALVICARNDWTHRAKESLANAHLIEAAPDLLEALKALVEASDPEELLDDESEIWQRAHAAIAKACP